MCMAVASTGVARQIFLKCSQLQQIDIIGDCTALSLKCPYTGRVQPIQRTAADTTHNNGIYMAPAKPCNRIACAMLMHFVTVANRLTFTGAHIYNHEFLCRAEMIEHLTCQTLILCYRKTYLHCVPPWHFVIMHKIQSNYMDVNIFIL